MTTIAYDGKTLAADSLMCGSFIDQCDTKKIFNKGGKLIAGSGDYGELLDFVNNDGELSKNSEAVVIDKKTGKYDYISGGNVPIPMKGVTALGTGSHFAMGAMLAGATAKQAVEIAKKLDTNTGGKIVTRQVKK